MVYYAFFFFVFYSCFWITLSISVLNLSGLVYQNYSYVNEEVNVQNLIDNELKKNNDPHWLKISKINDKSQGQYFYLPHLENPFFYLFVSLIMFLPLFFISSIHGLIRKTLYFLEQSLQSSCSGLLEDKEKS